MAEPKHITISGTKVGPGESVQINLNVAKLPTHTTLELPVHVIRSKNPGPVLLLTAGLHGDEINGIEILRRMIRDKNIIPENGSVIVVPIVNIFGFLIHSRAMPDGKDLNRCFPGSKNGSLGSMVAWTLMKKILPDVTHGVDFHTGGAQIDNFPHVRCVFDKKENLKVAEMFNTPFIIQFITSNRVEQIFILKYL